MNHGKLGQIRASLEGSKEENGANRDTETLSLVALLLECCRASHSIPASIWATG